MKRTILALVVASLSFAASAAPPGPPGQVDVNVTNPVLPVEVVNPSPVPALAPAAFQPKIIFTAINNQILLTTVPAGKRLVIEHVSYYSAGSSAGQLIFLTLRNGQFGPLMMVAEINPPHASADPSLTIQDGSQTAKAYFEAGQEVWLSASRSSGDYREIEVFVVGHYVTL